MGTSATRAKNKYNAKAYDSIRILVPKGEKEVLRAIAEEQGESLNKFINNAIDETLNKYNQNKSNPQ